MILRNTLYNLIGLGAPLLAAVVSIPPLITVLGAERFGMLTLIWAVVSYFGLFDLGLGRALTLQLSAAFARGENDSIGPLVWTALTLMAALGLLAGLLMASLASSGVELLRDVSNPGEITRAVYAMAWALPFIILTAGLRGALEARHAFGVINLIRLPMGLFTFLGPLAVALYAEPRLDLIAWVLTVGRIIGCLAHARFAWLELPQIRTRASIQHRLIAPLCASGGWLTVSNVVSPFMGYVDRFLIGAVLSPAAVAYYATPNELVTKLWIIPGALTAVLFPTFAVQMTAPGEPAWVLFRQAVLGLFAVLLPLALSLVMFSHELLSLWINPDFATHSAPVLQLFALGIFVNCLAHVPFTLIQSAGAARSTALIHCAELPLFLVALWVLTHEFGIIGAAMAWVLRMGVDTIMMFWVSTVLQGRNFRDLLNGKVALLALFALFGLGGSLLQSLELRVTWLIGVIMISIWLLFIVVGSISKQRAIA